MEGFSPTVAGVSAIRERAAAFLRDHETKKCTIGHHDWRYYRSGGGASDPVPLLTGGAGIGIAWLDLTPDLSAEFRTIAVDFPPLIETCDEVVDGLVAVLDTEKLERVHVVGQSAGGMFAELLSRRIPDRIRSLVLTSTGRYGPEDVERLRMRIGTARATPAANPRVRPHCPANPVGRNRGRRIPEDRHRRPLTIDQPPRGVHSDCNAVPQRNMTTRSTGRPAGYRSIEVLAVSRRQGRAIQPSPR